MTRSPPRTGRKHQINLFGPRYFDRALLESSFSAALLLRPLLPRTGLARIDHASCQPMSQLSQVLLYTGISPTMFHVITTAEFPCGGRISKKTSILLMKASEDPLLHMRRNPAGVREQGGFKVQIRPPHRLANVGVLTNSLGAEQTPFLSLVGKVGWLVHLFDFRPHFSTAGRLSKLLCRCITTCTS